MQNKGFIRLFAILLALVSIYYLSFSFVTRGVVRDAEKYAKTTVGDSGLSEAEYENAFADAKDHYLDSLRHQTVYSFLFLVDYTLAECQQMEVNLGLDLKGGMNVTMEVAVPDILTALSNHSQDPTFVKAIAQAKLNQRNSGKDFLTLFGDAFQEIDPGARLSTIFALRLKGKVQMNESTNAEVLKVLREEIQGAIDNSFNILRARIDKFGVIQPNIQRLEREGQVLVELPGVKDKQRVRKLLQGTANLEFWESYTIEELVGYQNTLQETSIAYFDSKKKEELPSATDSLGTDLADAGQKSDDDILDLVKTDSTISTQSSLTTFLAFNFPGSRDPSVVIGYAEAKDTAMVNKLLNLPKSLAAKPRDLKLMWSAKGEERGGVERVALLGLKVTTRNGQAPLDGAAVSDAYQQANSKDRRFFSISMSMNSQGAREWARITRDNIGKSIVIALDGYAYSYPNVQDEISGGRTEITGSFTAAEAKDLVNVLKSGKMPAPARIIRETVVGPSLGQEAIDNGLTSVVIAFFIILLYMIAYYGFKAGIVADIALMCNVLFLMGVLVSFNAVLTLPGIAGIVLTLGMSVDANVLIYERIREELAAGKGLRAAISDGYKNALSAIFDANITTFLTALVLFSFGTGPIKGFATTLMIGIATSFFSAVFISRLMFEKLLAKNIDISFTSQATKNWFKNTAIPFIKKRKLAYIISGSFILISIISLSTNKLDQGIDFVGGRDFIIRFDKSISTGEVRTALTQAFKGSEPTVKSHGIDKRQVKVSTSYLIESEDINAEQIITEALYEGLKPILGENIDFATFQTDQYLVSSEKVGPTIADDIKVAAMWAILFSLVIIFLYILLRFRNWEYSLGAITALVHDTMIVLGIFSLSYAWMPFSMEINQAFIAAILTVIGYSINDTVVVFDRIREFFHLHPKQDKESLINTALNSTLSRTFSTSLSTLFVLLAIFIFGGEVIRGFVFALLIGVVVGTYSSLFIATPVAYDAMKRTFNKENSKKKK